jgi:hypothetical protein
MSVCKYFTTGAKDVNRQKNRHGRCETKTSSVCFTLYPMTFRVTQTNKFRLAARLGLVSWTELTPTLTGRTTALTSPNCPDRRSRQSAPLHDHRISSSVSPTYRCE